MFENLLNYYNCLYDDTDKQEDIQRNILKLVDLISMATCWTQKPCETFLTSERKEVIDLPDCLNDCKVFEFEPFYTPFDVGSFKFTLVKQKGIDEETFPVQTFNYSEVDGVFKLNLAEIPTCHCGRNKCDCSPTYKLIATYDAGYAEIPNCLLPVFCEALTFIKEKNRCDCSVCQPCEMQIGRAHV